MDVKRNHLEQIANAVEAQFSLIKYDLAALAQDVSVITMTKDGERKIDLFFKTHDSVFVTISRVDKDGYIKYSTPNKKVFGKYIGNQEHNARVMREHRPVISDVFQAVQGFKSIAYAYPIFNNNKYDGTITVLIPISKLGDLLLRNTKLKLFGHSFLVSEKGIEIYSSFNADDVGKEIFSINEGLQNFPKIINNMLKKEDGSGYYWGRTSENDSTLVKKWIIYKPIELENTFWTLGLVSSEGELLGQIRGLRDDVMLIILISLTLSILLFALYFYTSRRSDLALLGRDQRFRIVTEQTGQLVYDYDFDSGKIVWSGAIEAITGYSEEEIQNFNISEWINNIHPDEVEETRKKLEQAQKHDEKFHIEYRFRKKNNNYVFVEDNGVFVKDQASGKVKCYGTMQDITARKEADLKLIDYQSNLEKLVDERTEELRIAKEMAERSDKLKSEFLAQVSHEIRTPINSILSFSTLIRDELKGNVNNELDDSFDILASAGRRIIRTIDLILNTSELQTNSYEPQFRSIDLVKDILEMVVDELSIFAKTKNIDLSLINNLNEQSAQITGDPYSIFQIFINLVDNALKYTEKGKVEILVYRNHVDFCVVEVNDTGIGISPEFLEVLFEPFLQEEQGYTRRFEGTGLGLTLVKNYCRINNAELEVESKKKKGSTFRVIFH